MDLAGLVLAGQADVRPGVLERAIATGVTRVVPAARVLPVYLLYWTAFVDDEGRLQLREDPYDRDGRVAAALARPALAAPRAGAPVRAPAGGPSAGAINRP
jgi:murein L,D-transpeptidase YcbB/YkuD